jgi:hypothetical protein
MRGECGVVIEDRIDEVVEFALQFIELNTEVISGVRNFKHNRGLLDGGLPQCCQMEETIDGAFGLRQILINPIPQGLRYLR